MQTNKQATLAKPTSRSARLKTTTTKITTTTTTRPAVRDTSVTQHHGDKIEGPLKPLRPSQQYRIGSMGALNCLCRETPVSLNISMIYRYISYIYRLSLLLGGNYLLTS